MANIKRRNRARTYITEHAIELFRAGDNVGLFRELKLPPWLALQPIATDPYGKRGDWVNSVRPWERREAIRDALVEAAK